LTQSSLPRYNYLDCQSSLDAADTAINICNVKRLAIKAVSGPKNETFELDCKIRECHVRS